MSDRKDYSCQHVQGFTKINEIGHGVAVRTSVACVEGCGEVRTFSVDGVMSVFQSNKK